MIEVRDLQGRRDATRRHAPYRFSGDKESPLVATAIHAGHDVRREVAELLALDEAARLREEDPHTDRLVAGLGFRGVVARSRFEVDLNRERDAAVYRRPEDSWDMHVWGSDVPDDVVNRSLGIYDSFYRDLATHLDQLTTAGPFVVFDVHSYNHRRNGPRAETAPQADNPDVNVGTGSMGGRWRPVVESFIESLSQIDVHGRALDVRENVRFKGANLARWIHQRYPLTGCALALEFKKTFMDEWTGEVDVNHLNELARALKDVAAPVLDALNGTVE